MGWLILHSGKLWFFLSGERRDQFHREHVDGCPWTVLPMSSLSRRDQGAKSAAGSDWCAPANSTKLQALLRRLKAMLPKGRTELGIGCIQLAVLSLGLPVHPACFLSLLAFGSGLLFSTRASSARRLDGSTLFLIGAFLALSLLSSAMSAYPERSFLVDLNLIPGFMLGAAVVLHFERRDVMRLIAAFVAAGVLMSLYLLAVAFKQPQSTPQQLMDLGGYTFFRVPNDLLLLALVLPFPLFVLFERHRRALLPGSLAAVSAIIAALAVYHSRSGILIAVLCVLAAGLWLRGRRFVLGLALLVPGLGAAVFLAGSDLADKFLSFGTYTSRLPMWMVAWDMFLESPWLGMGPGGYSLYYERYRELLSLPDWVVGDARHIPWAHNIYLELLAERGIVTTVVLAALGYRIFFKLIGNFPRFSGDGGWSVPVFAAMVMTLLAGVGELSLTRLWVVLWIFALVAICLVASQERGIRK